MSRLKNFIKHSDLIGNIYFQIMRCILALLSHVVSVRSKQILLTSYSGRQYSDSPKAIYLMLKADPEFKDYTFLWGFQRPGEFPEIPENEKLSIDSFRYFIKLLQSRYWISNTSIERLIPFKNAEHIYINSWHGIPLKHLGPDEAHLEFLPRNWYRKVSFDLLLSSGQYDHDIFKHIFPNTKQIKITGLPRNYELVTTSDHEKEAIKQRVVQQLGLDPNKKSILYAPTFREYQQVAGHNDFKVPFDDDFFRRMNEKYNFIFRGHYFVERTENSDHIFDASKYPDLNELFISTDLLITDYSSLVFDAALLEKPIILYLYDLEEYRKLRGFYRDPEELNLPKSYSQQELEQQIGVSLSNDYGSSVEREFNREYNQRLDLDYKAIKSLLKK
ncbi:CDP-glycerol glycerophosphotransferase family protein [Loigolactobacillus coryniformis]|uniref:CDP-glycerol glycerophosphotransferase family protein n=1 Tax=Loigolactobacillus coryniformis TaxID=1610 RepID=UPI0002E6EEED|nr:CDP-glycerol glycerophosphotransferase family protein [Loigolactobacillus coryniformis]